MATQIRHIAANRAGKDYLCADLHGMYAALMRALKSADFDPDRDRLFCTGDLIDRGPDSPACLGLLERPWFYSARGNHEQMMFDTLLGDNRQMELLWALNGGEWHYAEDPTQLQANCAEAAPKLPLAIELEFADGRSCGICHACCPTKSWQALESHLSNPASVQVVAQQLLWSRQRLQLEDRSPVAGIDAIVCGHSIIDRPCRLGNHLFIDTGAFLHNYVHLWEAEPLLRRFGL